MPGRGRPDIKGEEAQRRESAPGLEERAERAERAEERLGASHRDPADLGASWVFPARPCLLAPSTGRGCRARAHPGCRAQGRGLQLWSSPSSRSPISSCVSRVGLSPRMARATAGPRTRVVGPTCVWSNVRCSLFPFFFFQTRRSEDSGRVWGTRRQTWEGGGPRWRRSRRREMSNSCRFAGNGGPGCGQCRRPLPSCRVTPSAGP